MCMAYFHQNDSSLPKKAWISEEMESLNNIEITVVPQINEYI